MLVLRSLCLLLAALIAMADVSTQAQEITSNILTRVFQIKYRDTLGTCFTIDVADRQYLITARHVVNEIRDGDSIYLRMENMWKPISVKALYIEPSSIDVIVLVPPYQVSPSFKIEATSDGIILGQDLYFLGFPFGLIQEAHGTNFGFPLSMIKKGILSALMPTASNTQIIFLDGFTNPGFSGGPIVFKNNDDKSLKIGGVVRGYRKQLFDVLTKKNVANDSLPQVKQTDTTNMIIEGNSGIVVGYSIDCAIDVILKNPIGPLITH